MKPTPLILCVCLAAGACAAQTVGSFHRRFAVSGPVQLDIETGSGSIQVTGAPGSAVVVDATVRQSSSWWGGGDPEAVKAVEDNPPVEQSGNHVRLRQPRGSGWFNNISISYVVTTPPDTTLEAEAGSGTIRVGAISGDLRASTGSGSIRFDRIGGDARLQAGSGDIEGNQVGGRLSVATGSGHIEVQRVGRGVEASTGSGGMELDEVAGDVNAHAASGDIRLGGTLAANHHWDLSASSGGVEINLPAGTQAEADLRTASGGIHVRGPSQRQNDDGRRSWEGVLGTGGSPSARLSVHTSSGSIRVE